MRIEDELADEVEQRLVLPSGDLEHEDQSMLRRKGSEEVVPRRERLRPVRRRLGFAEPGERCQAGPPRDPGPIAR
jgi:hypothetical protein